jgi:NADPH:quinone reductase-like Zn-dependent oxidoreductase
MWPAHPPAPPDRMRAMVFDTFGGPDVLHEAEVATPEPGPDDVIVQVSAVSVGRVLDLGTRAGTQQYSPAAFPHILGAEHSGVVVAAGESVTSVRPGERVVVFPAVSCAECASCRAGREEACAGLEIIGVHRPGGYAEYTSVPARNAYRTPDGISTVEAAALALAGPVAINQLTQAGLRGGDWVLVQGAASALGSLTTLVAMHLGARVIATSRSDWKRRRLAELGVAAALDPDDDGFATEVGELTGGAGVAIAVDNLGAPTIWAKTLATLAVHGAVVSSGAFLGGRVEVNLGRLYSRCQRIVGVRTGNAESARRLWREVGEGLRPLIDRTFPVARAAQAHRYIEAGDNLGRVVLTHPQISQTTFD